MNMGLQNYKGRRHTQSHTRIKFQLHCTSFEPYLFQRNQVKTSINADATVKKQGKNGNSHISVHQKYTHKY